MYGRLRLYEKNIREHVNSYSYISFTIYDTTCVTNVMLFVLNTDGIIPQTCKRANRTASGQLKQSKDTIQIMIYILTSSGTRCSSIKVILLHEVIIKDLSTSFILQHKIRWASLKKIRIDDLYN